MTATIKGPARVTRPGQIIRREIEERGWTQKDLAEIMDRPVQAISEIVRGIKQINPATALELAEAFGTSAELWVNLEAHYRLQLAEQMKSSGEISKRSKIYAIVPVKELIKRSWIPPCVSVDNLEKEVCAFLGIRTLDEYPRVPMTLLYRRSNRPGPDEYARIAWIKRVESLANGRKLPSYSAPRLRKALPELFDLSLEPIRVVELQAFLQALGVGFILVEHLPKTFIDGATFRVGRNPIVALTLRYDRIDNFWFTLAHELSHVLSEDYRLYEESQDPAKKDKEDKADKEAAEWIVPKKALKEFLRTHNNYIRPLDIKNFASKYNRHPGIVVGLIQHSFQNFGIGRNFQIKIKPYFRDQFDR